MRPVRDDQHGKAGVLAYETLIDRAARDALADALAAYMRGEIDNFAFDDVAMGVRTDDRSVLLLGQALWFHYDDIKLHKVSATPEAWDFFRRVIAFLKCDRVLEVHEVTLANAARQRR